MEPFDSFYGISETFSNLEELVDVVDYLKLRHSMIMKKMKKNSEEYIREDIFIRPLENEFSIGVKIIFKPSEHSPNT